MSLEQELRDALHAATDHVRPDEATSLSAVRARGRAARRRRGVLVGSSVGALALVGVTVAATRLGGDDQRIIVSEQPTTTGTALPTTTPAPTTVRSVAPTTAVAGSTAPTTTEAAATPVPATAAAPPTAVAFDRVIWPGPEHAVFDDGVSAARSFVAEFVGIGDAPLGELRLEQPDIGAVDVYGRSESGAVRDVVVSTITVQRLDGHWYVTGAVADNVAIDAPLADAVVTSPVRVQGRGKGYEGTIVVQVRDAFQPAGEHLGQEIAVAGCCDELVPFDVAVSFSPASGPGGAIVATTDTGAEHGMVDFTVIPVRFAPSASPTGDVMTVRLFLADAVDGADGELVEVQRTVPKTTGVLRASLVALLDGPTPDDVSAGLMSWFPSGGAVESVDLTDGRATVRLSLPLDELPDAAPVDEVLGQLNETVFQFDNVHLVRYELAGGCAAFDTWLHRGCEFTRDGAPAPAGFLCPEGGLDEVAALQAEVDAGHQPWRTSAPDVAAACTFGAPDATVEPAGADTFRVTQPSTGRTVIVTVAQPLRAGAGGVWVVTSMVPAP